MNNLDLSVFPKVNKTEWENLAKKQLKGESPNEALQWQSFADFSLLPYYETSDLQGLENQIGFFKSLPDHPWKLYEAVDVNNEKESNKKALDALVGGCDGIIFNLKKIIKSDELLNDINSQICDLSFFNSEAGQHFSSEIKIEMTNENCFSESERITSPIDQLIAAISTSGKRYIYRTAFADFFLEIATVRALRFLLNSKLGKAEIKIHTHIPAHDQNDHQWFLNTTAGLASILGGSNSISFTTSLGDSRISRNVGNLIREESGISTYKDQCGGSYYIEVLTHKLIEETLKKSNL